MFQAKRTGDLMMDKVDVETVDRLHTSEAALEAAAALAQQPAAPSGEAGAFDANFLRSVANLCRAAYDLCQPKPQRTPEDDREHYGELCLLELKDIADEIERRIALAAQQPAAKDEARPALEQKE